jgi:hypothetical protein
LNYTLAKQLKAKDSGVPGIEFNRAYSILKPGEAIIGLQESVYGYPLHAGMGFRPEIKGGVLKPVIVSGNIGRLHVHPALMEYVSYAFPFRQLAKALKREQEYMGKLSEIRVEQNRIVLIKGATTAAPAAPTLPAAPAAAVPSTPPATPTP